MKKFDNYVDNLSVLETAKEQNLENEFIIGGIIDKFFIQFELGWKVLKELLSYEGVATARNGSPREIIKEAYKYYSCIDEKIWLSMLIERNSVAHIYDSCASRKLADKIISDYVPAFQLLKKSIISKYGEILDTL